MGNSSGSKYATMADTMNTKVEILDDGIDDSIKQKQVESQIKRVDEETKHQTKEIENSPVDTTLAKQQAKSDYDNALSENDRIAKSNIFEVEHNVREGEQNLKLAQDGLKTAKQGLELAKDKAVAMKNTADLRAKQDYDRTLSTVGNMKEAMKLRIQKCKQDAEERKLTLQIKLDTIKAKNEAHNEKIGCIETLYKDLKEISLALGDAKKQ